ncbi:MAG: peptidoglycan-binding protein [Pseudomonadota bacterium]|nr:peptidoglycan-binding protein [Pseudomonadota bacterium]
MREVLAAADHDFVMTEPASKLKHLREKLLTARRRGSRRTGRRGRRYLSILVAGFFVAAAAAILLNALVWQQTRHPAPLFSRAPSGAPTKEPMIPGLIAVPPPRPQPAVTPIQAQDKPVEKPAAQKSPVEKPPLEMPAGGYPRQNRITSSPPHDEISQLLKAPPARHARPTTEAAAPAAPSKLVLAAQRALVKLGFVLNPDGVAGTTTRQAIERYERDHGLPVRGDLSRAIMRLLRAETGITIN